MNHFSPSAARADASASDFTFPSPPDEGAYGDPAAGVPRSSDSHPENDFPDAEFDVANPHFEFAGTEKLAPTDDNEITADQFPDQLAPRDAFAAALWDFDGTLVDSEPLWQQVATDLMAGFGVEWTTEQHQHLIGMALLDSAAYLLEVAGRADLTPEQLVAQMVEGVASRIRNADIDWVPGALEMLQALSRAQVPCALVSASYRPVLQAVLERVPGLFDVVVAGDEVSHGKPDPEPYLRACELLGVRSGECIVFEDSLPGTTSGQASGATVIAVRNLVELPAGPRRVNLNTLLGQTPESLVPQVIAAREVAATEGMR